MTLVAGADVWKGQWVAVVLEDCRFSQAVTGKTILDVMAKAGDVSVLAVDIPIGLSDGGGHRECDIEARSLLGPRSSSVFLTPPREIISEPDYRKANELCKDRFGCGVSRQAHALRTKILEVDRVARNDHRLIEAHPEVSFCTMKRAILSYSKKTWNGQNERRRLLASQGIQLPGDLAEAGLAQPDDVLDAAAVAWTAWRALEARAETLPASSTGCSLDHRPVIWR